MREPSIRGLSRFPNGMILGKMFYLLYFTLLLLWKVPGIKIHKDKTTSRESWSEILDLLNPLPEIERTGRIPKESTKYV